MWSLSDPFFPSSHSMCRRRQRLYIQTEPCQASQGTPLKSSYSFHLPFILFHCPGVQSLVIFSGFVSPPCVLASWALEWAYPGAAMAFGQKLTIQTFWYVRQTKNRQWCNDSYNYYAMIVYECMIWCSYDKSSFFCWSASNFLSNPTFMSLKRPPTGAWVQHPDKKQHPNKTIGLCWIH